MLRELARDKSLPVVPSQQQSDYFRHPNFAPVGSPFVIGSPKPSSISTPLRIAGPNELAGILPEHEADDAD